MLDVGCGSGRMALPLTGYLNSEGRYAGFDISQKAIAWCQEHITSAHPNFQFEVSDIYNSLYNPKGKYQSLDFRFPYPDFIHVSCSSSGLRPSTRSARR